MRSMIGRRVIRLAISLALGDGMPFAYSVPAGERGQRGLRAAETLDALLAGGGPKSRRPGVTRSDLVHMRALQALDAESDGASERAIAELRLRPQSTNPRAGTTARCAPASATCSTMAAVFATAATATCSTRSRRRSTKPLRRK